MVQSHSVERFIRYQAGWRPYEGINSVQVAGDASNARPHRLSNRHVTMRQQEKGIFQLVAMLTAVKIVQSICSLWTLGSNWCQIPYSARSYYSHYIDVLLYYFSCSIHFYLLKQFMASSYVAPMLNHFLCPRITIWKISMFQGPFSLQIHLFHLERSIAGTTLVNVVLNGDEGWQLMWYR